MMDDTAMDGSQEAKTTNDSVYQQDSIRSHQHRDSNSTQASDSTDSSPTTTISTIDSASLSSDPSPSSSPESPITLVPLSSFAGSAFGLDSFQSLKMNDTNRSLQLSDERPMTSPGPRKAKNPKALALNLRPSIDAFQTSEPSSPSFIKPPTLKGRKKPSLLSLNTGTAALEPLASPGIPSMLQRRSLKHSVSSPQMLSLATPGFGPSGGMTFGERAAPRVLGGASRFKESNLGDTFTISEDVDQEAPAGPQMATRGPGMIGGDSFDRPHSGEDAHSPSYPDGPILMHEPFVHLYSEPTLEEALKFDVVINVAREVKNPFKAKQENEEREKTQETTATKYSDPISSFAEEEPETAASMMSFKTAFESQPAGSETSSPSTPRPNIEEARAPEYIHVPWDHNTDVKDELLDLCLLIQARAKEEKKVLIHCQQGASRSATLVIAYGMYLNQDKTPNEVYSMMQSKSRWVNPNMSLLFSLNDFKKILERRKAEKNMAIRSKSQAKHSHSVSADNLDSPSTASRARGNSTPSVRGRDGALPSKDREPEPETPSDALGSFDFGFGERLNINAPIQRFQPPEEWESGLMSPRLTEMTRNPIIYAFSREATPESAAVPDEQPSLFSPRVFEFPRTSFFPPAASIPFSISIDDPRSPPIQGEAPITRSIDDFL